MRADGFAENAVFVMPADVRSQVAAAAVVPPAPVQFVNFHFQSAGRDFLPAAVHGNHFELLVFAGFEIAVVARSGCFKSHKGVERGVSKTFLVDAEPAAGFKHFGDESQPQHTGQAAFCGEEHVALCLSAVVQFSVKNLLLFGAEAFSRIVKNIIFVSFKRGFGSSQAFGYVGFQSGSHAAVQPGGLQRKLFAALRGKPAAGSGHFDFQPVGQNGFHPQVFGKPVVADLHHGPPQPGRRIGLRSHFKDIKPVNALCGRFGIDFFVAGIVNGKFYRKPRRKHFLAVLQNKGQEQRVARPPNAPFAKDHAFQAVFGFYAGGTEFAVRQGVAARKFQVGKLVFPLGHQQIGRFFQKDIGLPFGVGSSPAQFLVLVGIKSQLHVFQRFRGNQVTGKNKVVMAVRIFYRQADVGGQEIFGFKTVGGVIRHIARVIPFHPFVIFGIVVTGSIIGRAVGKLRRRVVFGTTEQGVRLAKTQADAVNGAGVGFHHFAQVNGIPFPFVVGFVGRAGQDNPFVVNIFAHPAQRPAVAAAQVVILQKLFDVVGINLKNHHIHRPQVDGLERNNPFFLSRQDVSFPHKTHLRRSHFKISLQRVAFVEGIAAGAADIFLQDEIVASVEFGFGKHFDDVVFHAQRHRSAIRKIDQPFQVLVRRNAVGKNKFQMQLGSGHHVVLQKSEFFQRRHGKGFHHAVSGAHRFAIQCYYHLLRLIRTLDAVHRKPEHAVVFGRNFHRQRFVALFGRQSLFYRGNIRISGGLYSSRKAGQRFFPEKVRLHIPDVQRHFQRSGLNREPEDVGSGMVEQLVEMNGYLIFLAEGQRFFRLEDQGFRRNLKKFPFHFRLQGNHLITRFLRKAFQQFGHFIKSQGKGGIWLKTVAGGKRGHQIFLNGLFLPVVVARGKKQNSQGKQCPFCGKAESFHNEIFMNLKNRDFRYLS